MILENQSRSFPDSSDKFSTKNDPQDSNSKFHRSHHRHHHRHHHSHHPPKHEPRCHGCGGAIVDREFLSAGDLRWHCSSKCLKCDQCGISMNLGSKCILNGDKIFCCHDHKRLFGKKCRKCEDFISQDDFVVRTNSCDLYHVTCFVCEVCHFGISSGQQYGQIEGRIYCKLHFESFFTSGQFESPPFCIESSTMPSSVQPINQFNTPPSLDSSTNHSLQEFDLQTNQSSGYNYNENARCRSKRKKTSSTEDSFVFQQSDPFADQFLYRIDDSNPVEFHMTGEDYQFMKEGKSLSTVYSNNPNNHNRQKRLRTSFKHHQLRTMKSYFASNHNPDAKDLKELAQKTGLTKRILQVWFQNARAKYRRNNMKQDVGKGEDGLRDDLNGTDGPSSITDKSHTSSESPHCQGGTLKGIMSPSLSDISTPSLGNHFDEGDATSDLGRVFLTS